MTQATTQAAFITAREVAALFGWHPDHFSKKKRDLVKIGFPEPDPVVRKYLRADVEAWIEGRRRIKDGATVGGASGINLDAA